MVYDFANPLKEIDYYYVSFTCSFGYLMTVKLILSHIIYEVSNRKGNTSINSIIARGVQFITLNIVMLLWS